MLLLWVLLHSAKGEGLAGASGAVLSVFNEVLSGEDNEIKNLLQETIKLQSNVIAKYDRLKYFKDSKNNTDFENQEVDLLIRTIENDRESLNKNLFTISENYKRIISEKRIKNILLKKAKLLKIKTKNKQIQILLLQFWKNYFKEFFK